MAEGPCLALRARAFDLLNRNHQCASDDDCLASTWPGCPKPLNKRDHVFIEDIRQQFVAGKCSESPQQCAETPVMYCQRNLCVARH